MVVMPAEETAKRPPPWPADVQAAGAQVGSGPSAPRNGEPFPESHTNANWQSALLSIVGALVLVFIYVAVLVMPLRGAARWVLEWVLPVVLLLVWYQLLHQLARRHPAWFSRSALAGGMGLTWRERRFVASAIRRGEPVEDPALAPFVVSRAETLRRMRPFFAVGTVVAVGLFIQTVTARYDGYVSRASQMVVGVLVCAYALAASRGARRAEAVNRPDQAS